LKTAMSNFQVKKIIISKRKHDTSGFTVLETIVAIGILALAITATFSAAQSGLASSIESRDQVLAFYLAQEAVEMLRNARDENGIRGDSWLSGITEGSNPSCPFGGSCTVDATTKTWDQCPVSGCPNMRQNTTGTGIYGLYGYDQNWSETQFKRTISLSSISATEILLTVTIEWGKASLPKQFKVKETLLNWQ
jgi:type II secretory pathway pseudopilin PulG